MTRTASLYRAFAECAHAHPDLKAFVSLSGMPEDALELTYGDALWRISCLSALLPDAPGAAALILGPKTADTILWQLACNLKGLVFTPCDGALPEPRVRELVGRLQPAVIIGPEDKCPSLASFDLRGEKDSHRVWVSENFRRWPEQTSHIVFSSGSTGKPKAILLPADPVIAVTREQARLTGLGPGKRFGWLLSPAFDASLSDAYSTLLSGACLYVANFSMSRVKKLVRFFTEGGITHTDLSPAILALVPPHEVPSLESVVFGGELAPESAVQQWRHAGKKLFNAYGPTEATICTSFGEVDDSWVPSDIGTPFPGVTYRMEPTGAEGVRELWIGGTHLALGYDDPQLTAHRFVLDEDNQRFFRTGDVCELSASGRYHFKGRADRQFKHLGILVCPEEIEQKALAMGCHEAVLSREDDKMILYVAGGPSPDELRRRLREALPSGLVPHFCKSVSALPRNITGKVAL